jgi:hypothetical protein
MLQSDVAAFARAPGDDDGTRQPLADQLRRAEIAVRRAEGVLVFADASQPAVQELRRLYEAVAPVIAAEEMAS